MIRPTPGFLGHSPPAVKQVFFANSDVSGISIFEEAQYHGVAAAERALKAISRG
jgi:hypothetical protein